MIHKNGSKCWDRKFHLLCVRMSAPVYVHVCMCMSSFHTHINQIQRHRDQGERDCGVFQELYEIQCNVEGRGEIQDRLTRSWFWKTLNAIKIWHTLSRGDAWHGQFFLHLLKITWLLEWKMIFGEPRRSKSAWEASILPSEGWERTKGW